MLSNELWKKLNEQKVIVDFLFYLYERWQDEKEYEDIKDDLKEIKNHIPQAQRMTKRPFGVVCKCEDCDLSIYIKKNGDYLQMFAKS